MLTCAAYNKAKKASIRIVTVAKVWTLPTCLNLASSALKTSLSLAGRSVLWCFDDMTLSCHVFECVFLGPRQSRTSAASWCDRESRLAVICPDHDRETRGCELHTHFSSWICPKRWHSISAGMSCVQSPKANATVCNRRRFEVALNTCQDTSLLLPLAILTKAATQKNTHNGSSYSRVKPLAPQLTGSSAALWCNFFL